MLSPVLLQWVVPVCVDQYSWVRIFKLKFFLKKHSFNELINDQVHAALLRKYFQIIRISEKNLMK